MIAGVACVPQPPLLLPGLTGGPVPEVARLRAAADAAVAELLRQDLEEVVVIGAAPATSVYRAEDPAPAGRFGPAPWRPPEPGALPVSLAVGRELLAGGSVPLVLQGIAESAWEGECARLGRDLAVRPARTGLLVAADGSARRGEKAPGYIDARATVLDARIGEALDSADVEALLKLDPALCSDLLVAGRAAWQVMAAACRAEGEDGWRTRTHYDDDPFGVAYRVVTWTRR